MTSSVNNVLSVSGSYIDSRESLFSLKKFTALTKVEYKNFNKELIKICFASHSQSIQYDAFDEINAYLAQLKKGENIQLNGVLSQVVDRFLKSLKAHLQEKAPIELRDFCELQIKEIYDHLLIGAAGLELIVQAIYDQRLDHISLGFRDALMHCYYAIEQLLSHLITLKTHKVDKTNEDHNLIHLAQTAKIPDLEKKWESFLKEITLHLPFSYPEDDRLFFKQKLKAVLFLNHLDNPQLDQKKTTKAVRFCFEMYTKSLSFITEAASAQVKGQSKLLQVIQELKDQLLDLSDKPQVKKTLIAKTQKSEQTLINQVNRGLDILGPLDTYSNLPDQRIYAAIGTIKRYLQLMKISLEIPQESSRHALQKFIKVETLTNIDKLFKQLFRAVILLLHGNDNHQHTLTSLFDLTESFYKRDEMIAPQLKEINLGISHHYLHTRKRRDEPKLHLIYSRCLLQACSIVTYSSACTVVPQKDKQALQNLKSNISAINQLMKQSFELFIQFLEPTLSEIKERFMLDVVT